MVLSTYQSSAGVVAAYIVQGPHTNDGPQKPPKGSGAGFNTSALQDCALGPGSWLVSKGLALLSASVSPEAFVLRITLQDHVLLDQDLYRPQEDGSAVLLSLLGPEHTGGAAWLLLLAVKQPAGSSRRQAAGLPAEASIGSAAAAPRPILCFRFNSLDAGSGFSSLVQAVQREQLEQARAAAAQHDARDLAEPHADMHIPTGPAAVMRTADLTSDVAMQPAAGHTMLPPTLSLHNPVGAAAAAPGSGLQVPLLQVPGSGPYPLEQASLKAVIQQLLRDPAFERLVAQVEEAWDELDAAAGE